MPRAPSTRRSPSRTCSGGSTCTRRWTTRSRRGRCIRPTAAKSRTSTRTRERFAPSSRPRSARFRCSSSGDRGRRFGARSGLRRASKIVEGKYSPTLTLVYLPHLDYNLQRFGVSSERIGADLAEIERVTMDLVEFYEARGARVIVLSEYGLTDVSTPVHPNRAAPRARPARRSRRARARGAGSRRERGLRRRRSSGGARLRERPAPPRGRSRAPEWTSRAWTPSSARTRRPRIASITRAPAISSRSRNPTRGSRTTTGCDDERAPDYARTVDIHRKPGYDPVELFLDPAMPLPSVSVGWKLAKRAAGFRTLLDVIPARRHARPRLARPLRRLGRTTARSSRADRPASLAPTA